VNGEMIRKNTISANGRRQGININSVLILHEAGLLLRTTAMSDIRFQNVFLC
jgi:hypothetical protein